MDEIHQGAEDRMITSLMTVDQTAAFNTVRHDLLIENLTRYKVRPEAINWVTDYLSGRTQYVVLGRSQSLMKSIHYGVPQGSVIGPLFFAVYTNDMTDVVKRHNCENICHSDRQTLFGRQCRECGVMTNYADDLTYVVGSRNRLNNQICIMRSLDEIKLYLNDNGTDFKSPGNITD